MLRRKDRPTGPPDETEFWQGQADAYQPHLPHLTFQVGDSIADEYQVQAVLGTTILTVSYLAYAQSQRTLVVVKTLRNAYLRDPSARKRFRQEAAAWVKLGAHPYVVRAHAVKQIQPRSYLVLEYVAPDARGRNSLQAHLERKPPSPAQSLRWAIQLCHALEHAYENGLRHHGDLKPANVLIARDKTAKVADFGLAAVLGDARAVPQVKLSVHEGLVRLSRERVDHQSYGTPTHMAPEQFTDATRCDERSDIYSVGVLLYQMASGGRLPFLAPVPERDQPDQATLLQREMQFWREMRRLHADAVVPSLDSPLFSIAALCLEKAPRQRYQSFAQLRAALERLLAEIAPEAPVADTASLAASSDLHREALGLVQGGQHAEAVEVLDEALQLDPAHALAWTHHGACLRQLARFADAVVSLDRALALDADLVDAWIERGRSLRALGRIEDANGCFDAAVASDPESATAWYYRGLGLSDLGQPANAVVAFDRALDLEPRLEGVWLDKAACLYELSRFEEAIECYERALRRAPGNARALVRLALSLGRLGRHDEADERLDRALVLDPGLLEAWNNKGIGLRDRRRPDEALACFAQALAIDAENASVWTNRAMALSDLGRFAEAVIAFDEALARDPRVAPAWIGRGMTLAEVGWPEVAVHSYERAIELEPWLCLAWNGRGLALSALERHEEAIACFDVALGIDPTFGSVWNNKGLSLAQQGRKDDALTCFEKALHHEPDLAVAWRNRAETLARLGRVDDALASNTHYEELRATGVLERRPAG